MKKTKIALALSVITIIMASCNDSGDDATTGDVDISSVVQAKFGNATTNALGVWVTDSTVIITSDGRPNHKSPYWGVGNANYEAFQLGHAANPNSMGAQLYVMTIPKKPARANTHEATSTGPIGMALNGVPIFNDQEGPNTPLDAARISSFDKAGGHPAQGSDYHYHVTDFDGTYTTKDDAKLVGFLRDGFPIYGRKDNDGTYPGNLDAYNGHTGATTEFPNGIYHYHTRNENYLNTGYYILKSGSYYGTKGTFTQ